MYRNPDSAAVLHQLFAQGITSKEEVDVAMLRYYVYGFTDKIENCDLIKRVLEKTHSKRNSLLNSLLQALNISCTVILDSNINHPSTKPGVGRNDPYLAMQVGSVKWW